MLCMYVIGPLLFTKHYKITEIEFITTTYYNYIT